MNPAKTISPLFLCATLLSVSCKPRVRYAPYGIGSEQIVVTDYSRETPANGTTPAIPYRQLQLYIWYPATSAVDAGEVSQAKLDTRGAPFPLVLFVHSSDGWNYETSYLEQALASDGYVVAAADLPLTYLETPLPGPTELGCNLQVGDQTFIADQLGAAAQDSSNPLYGAIDPSQGIAIEGFSTGGSVTLDAAYSFVSHDSRIKGIVALAPDACFFASKMFTTRSVPMMVIAGTDDHYNPPVVNGQRAYELATTSPRWLAMLTGGTHLFFSTLDIPDGSPTPDMPGDPIVQAFAADESGVTECNVGPITTEADPVIDFDLQHTLTVQLSEAFLDKWMWNDDSTITSLTASHDPHLVLSSAGQ